MINPPPDLLQQDQIKKRCYAIRDHLVNGGLYRSSPLTPEITPQNHFWRIAIEPFWITKQEWAFLKNLGNHLLSFYQATNKLYLDSAHGREPSWIAQLLDRGKPERTIEYNRMNRFKHDLPGVIRPDLIPTEEGVIATELDAVPGGIGLTAALMTAYGVSGETGSSDAMVAGFERMIRSLTQTSDITLAIVVSEESKDYRPEMAWLGEALRKRGLSTFVVDPSSLQFTEEGLWIEGRRIDVLYRFFELFDLKNIPKSELILYAAKKQRVVLTPPLKTQLEEKSAYALFHHPALKPLWQRQLGSETYSQLERLFPKSWIMDPSEIPPHAIIPDLMLDDKPVTDYRQLESATQKERQWVIKPSGFSEWAWGSRGVSVGHDLSEEEWRKAIGHALSNFSTTPHILQKFHKGKKIAVSYYDFEKDQCVKMEGRVRLSPYYFVDGKEAQLGGGLATICSLEKKLIHGMVDAVMAPCAVLES